MSEREIRDIPSDFKQWDNADWDFALTEITAYQRLRLSRIIQRRCV